MRHINVAKKQAICNLKFVKKNCVDVSVKVNEAVS
jgi:hypothetical protein